ncbi:hypothetical protein HN011_011693 [Eciton burchellii]|nr:hypothetical protein HN011_011693 [Eciton burchellii]
MNRPSDMWIEQQSKAQAIEDTEKAVSERSIHERPECGRERAITEIRLESQARDIRILEMELKMIKREIELLKIHSLMTDSASCTNPAPDARASTKTDTIQG